ncbi:MAG: hypothetical protein JJ855_09950 [Rhodospirillales bacterium]|nr:hypothetical protein [Rhodospirillales bacterium]
MGTTDNTAVQRATQNLQNKSLANAAASSGLSGSVGMGARNAPEDVMKVSTALTANGLMEAPHSHADNTLFKGIIGAQERMDSSLKRDGLVNPGGPTEQTFARLAGQGFVKPVPAHPATPDAPAQPATGNAALNAEIRAGNKQNAVAAAQARVKANLSDDNRSDFRKAQDRDRLDKAREDAERAQGRARHEEAVRRRRNLEQQAEVQRKATTAAEKQAAEAGKAVNAGLTKLVRQAGKAIDNAVRHAQQNADLPSRHPRVREAGLGQSGNPGLSSVDVDSGVRGNDKLVADRNVITLSDDAVAANRRTADALGKVRGVGDLPRFTSDAINTGGDKAVYEVADLIGQVRERDPEQAKELLETTLQNVAPAHRQSLADTVREITVTNTQDDESVSDMPPYALLAEDGTEPSEPEEPSNPSDPEEPTDPSEPKEPEEDPCEDLRAEIDNLKDKIQENSDEQTDTVSKIQQNEKDIKSLREQIASKVDTRDAIDSVGGVSYGRRVTPLVNLLGYAFRIDELNRGEDNQLLTNWENRINDLVQRNKELSAKLEQLREEKDALSKELEEAKGRLIACEDTRNK